ncbi:hypothetical protein [Nostoc linckia]|uniref:hypothetical protein n=1 Tax=Nostoc linckia TaxID=92942 RepID=UPI0015D49C06|nr:hypothetical protein [Nostoc linckia]
MGHGAWGDEGDKGDEAEGQGRIITSQSTVNSQQSPVNTPIPNLFLSRSESIAPGWL